MTKKESFELIKNVMNDNADIVAFCDNEIAKLDNRTAKAQEKAAEKKEQGDELRQAIYGTLTDEFQTIADILLALNAGEDVTASKVSARMKALIDMELAEKADVVIPATEDTKKRTVKGYRLAVHAE